MERKRNGHRWTQEEVKSLIILWMDEEPIEEIAKAFNVSVAGLNKFVTRLRNSGVPLKYRKRGNKAGRTGKLWSQSEVEYALRRRQDGVDVNTISSEMNRTVYAVQAMILKMRTEGVPVPLYGRGRHRLYDTTTLMSQYCDASSPLAETLAL